MKLMPLAVIAALMVRISSGLVRTTKRHDNTQRRAQITRPDAQRIGHIIERLAGNSSTRRSKKFSAVTKALFSGSAKASDDFTESIRSLTDDAVNSLIEAARSSQTLLDHAYDDWTKCQISETSWPAEEQAVTTARADHSSCRTEESGLNTQSSGCAATLDSLEASKKESCDEVSKMSESSSAACDKISSDKDYLDYVRRMADYWSTQKVEIEEVNSKCEAFTEYVTTNKSLCDSLSYQYSKQKEVCDEFNTNLNQASCSLATVQQRNCKDYEMCYGTTASTYSDTQANVEAEESNFKHEYVALKHIDCLVSAMEQEDADGKEGAISACLAAEIDSSEVAMSYHTITPAQSCTLPTVYPCTEEYEIQEFGNMPEGTVRVCQPCILPGEVASSANQAPAEPEPVAMTTPPGAPADKCYMDGDFLFAANGGSCLLTKADGESLDIDYTKAKFTQYKFIMKIQAGNTRDHNIHPHGGFLVCNKDGNSYHRGRSPEMWFIDRGSDWGYGLYNGGWGHNAIYKDKNYYGASEPIDSEEKEWDVIMEWTGSTLLLNSWTVQGVSFDNYDGKNSGCSATDSFTPRVWAYSGRDKFGIRFVAAYQGDSVTQMTPITGVAPALAAPVPVVQAAAPAPVTLMAPPGSPPNYCYMDGDFLFAQNDGSCVLSKAGGVNLDIDYTKSKFTKYEFTMKVQGGSTRDNNISPHGGFLVCNKDGNGYRRGRSPEMWFIDRGGDWGYGLYNGGWGHNAIYRDHNHYGASEPNDSEEKHWEVVMEWTGSTLIMYSWKVEGVSFDNYKGKNSGCSASDSFAPRVWAYPGSKFGIKFTAAYQGDSVDQLMPVPQ